MRLSISAQHPHMCMCSTQRVAGCRTLPRLPTRMAGSSPTRSGWLPVRSARRRCRRGLGGAVAAASGGGGGSGSSGGGDKTSAPPPTQLQLKLQLQLLGTLLVRYPAILGSLAVGAGYFLHLPPLGNMHWNSHDALLGLQCALPILVIDAALMLPDFSPGTTTKTIKLKVPKAIAERMRQQEALKEQQQGAGSNDNASSSTTEQQEQGESSLNGSQAASSNSSTSASASSSSQQQEGSAATSSAAATLAAEAAAALASAAGLDGVDLLGDDVSSTSGKEKGQEAGGEGQEELVEVERTINVRADQHPILAALYRIQLEKATENVGRVLWLPFELVLLLMWHLAEEMAYRAIALTWAAGWTIDRLYEAGVDDTVDLLGMQLATPQAGAVFAAIGCTTVSLALLVQRNLFPLQLIAKAEQELDAQSGSGSGGKTSDKERKRMRRVLDKVRTGLVRQRKWSTAIEGTRDVTEWAAYSTSFLLTGNLLAPYITGVTSDLLFSLYQRLKQRQVERAERQTLAQIESLHQAAVAVRDAKRAALEPPPQQSFGATPAPSAAAEQQGEEAAGSEEQNGSSIGSSSSSSESNGSSSSNGSSVQGEGGDAVTTAGSGSNSGSGSSSSSSAKAGQE